MIGCNRTKNEVWSIKKQIGGQPRDEAPALMETIAGKANEEINHSLTFLAIAANGWYESCFRGH